MHIMFAEKFDLWAPRTSQSMDDDEDEDMFLSCSEDGSDDSVYYTPPSQSPIHFDSDDDMNIFEESLENFEEEKGFTLFIHG